MSTAIDRNNNKNFFFALITSNAVLVLLRILLGALFIYASHDKILNPNHFAISIRAYKIIPIEFSNLFALMLAWSEMIAGVLIIAGIFTKQAASAIFIMLAMFISAIVISIVRGLVIDCGCFKSEGGHAVDFSLLIRDIFLLVAAYLVIRYERGYLTLSRLFSGSR
jgi:uncharacterized membrane protein YphA (DoxX/SURF4 family)